MKVQTLSSSEIRKLGIEALAKVLGPVGMVRFLQQYEGGMGDYTRERKGWLKDLNVRDIVKEIKVRRKRK
jgi:hypothetical protein